MKCVSGILVAALLVQINAYSISDHNLRITDGESAEPGQFPYMVSIELGLPPLIPFSHSCGGAIIDERHILTAAHCASGIIGKLGKQQIKAGKYYFNKQEDNVQTIEVIARTIHEGYPNTLFPKVAQHDIAILKLKSPLKFDQYVQPVRLPVQDSVQTGESVLTGWGSVSKWWLPKLPEVLQYATIPIIDFETCKAAVQKEQADAPLYDTMICTGPLGGSISACTGDSGGPLVQSGDLRGPIPVPNHVVVGIVSWGFMPCGSSGAPSIYTRVSSYVDWIKSNIAY